MKPSNSMTRPFAVRRQSAAVTTKSSTNNARGSSDRRQTVAKSNHRVARHPAPCGEQAASQGHIRGAYRLVGLLRTLSGAIANRLRREIFRGEVLLIRFRQALTASSLRLVESVACR